MPTPAEIKRNREYRGYIVSFDLDLDARTLSFSLKGKNPRRRTFELKNTKRLDFNADASAGTTQQEIKVTFLQNGFRKTETLIVDDYATLSRIYDHMAGMSRFHGVAVKLNLTKR